MPGVYSKRRGADPIPDGAVYVGRGTVWGNPWKIGEDGTRDEVVERYRAAVMADGKAPLRKRIRQELAGKDLVCWCQSPSDEDPLPCHATVLLEIANGEPR